ncbi:MAG: leucyl/phenylalanyl-tRNA--protein transferase [Bacteroidetes bacterium]|nr:leucyl/phenylalanyl-tRNA--protein transferase [Bacteroidota bacterium]
MPVFQLTHELAFPDPENADHSGLLAIGGDLSAERLILAYANGIFPWYSQDDPVLWWSPDPRMILYPHQLKISKSMRQSLRNKNYEVRFDTSFSDVIRACKQAPRQGQEGTWITKEMQEAYIHLHDLGWAHSVETFLDNKLVGGLYGVSIGKAFFGESMFFEQRDASKIALVYLVDKLIEWNFTFIDAQVETEHLRRMGAINISRKQYLELLRKAINYPTIKGKW